MGKDNKMTEKKIKHKEKYDDIPKVSEKDKNYYDDLNKFPPDNLENFKIEVLDKNKKTVKKPDIEDIKVITKTIKGKKVDVLF